MSELGKDTVDCKDSLLLHRDAGLFISTGHRTLSSPDSSMLCARFFLQAFQYRIPRRILPLPPARAVTYQPWLRWYHQV